MDDSAHSYLLPKLMPCEKWMAKDGEVAIPSLQALSVWSVTCSEVSSQLGGRRGDRGLLLHRKMCYCTEKCAIAQKNVQSIRHCLCPYFWAMLLQRFFLRKPSPYNLLIKKRKIEFYKRTCQILAFVLL